MRSRNEIFENARIMVVGCGALGNEVLKNLVLCGAGHIVCVDYDRIEKGNLSKSVLFRPSDARQSRPKAEVAAAHIMEMVPGIDVTPVCADISCDVGLGLIRKMDVVIGCVDNRWARFMINRHCARTGRTWIDGGISISEGTSRTFIPGRCCYACSLSNEEMAELRRRVSCANVIRDDKKFWSAPTTSITASIIGAVQVQEALKVLAGSPSLDGRIFFVDTDIPEARTAAFDAFSPECPEHDEWGPVESCDVSVSTTVAELLDSFGDSLIMRDDCFVDRIVSMDGGEEYGMMVPGRRVSSMMKTIPGLDGRSPAGFYQNEYRVIDRDFPYLGLTLGELGIPGNDILHINCCGRDRYLEMI